MRKATTHGTGPARRTPGAGRRLHRRWFPVGLLAAGLLAYANSLGGAFVFDDEGAILENPTIRSLAHPAAVLSPPTGGLPVTGRPITNLSFALNYAVHGSSAWGYHVVNGLIHVLAALTLFGVIRRTLEQPRLQARFGAHAPMLAAAIALLWVLHPLQTAGVTYISQRAESLASLLVLVALYAFIRSVHASHPRRWLTASATACWLGIGTKEIAYAIPVLIAAYDRIFVVSSWRDVWRVRGLYHLVLLGSWLPLAWLILSTENRGGTWAAAAGYSPWEYLRLQCQALVHYLRLVVWPHPLVFDYGRNLAAPPWPAVLPHALVMIALFAAMVFALRRRPALGWLGLGFFALLAPTSSVVPIADPMFEHRMYLPSAAVLTALAIGAFARAGPRCAWGVAPLALLLGALTVARNADYASALHLWQDTVEKRPDNSRALVNLGRELMERERYAEALPLFERAHALTPDVPVVVHNLALALDFTGRRAAAITHYRRALELAPENFLARANLANALAAEGDLDAALAEYAIVLREAPGLADAHRGYARVLLRIGRLDEAITHLQRDVALRPRDPEAHFSLGDALARAGRYRDAIPAFREVLRLQPDHVGALNNLGNALLLTRDAGGAITAFERALALAPDPKTHTNLGFALLMEKRPDDATKQFEAALRLAPDYAPARAALEKLTGSRIPAP